MRNTIFQRHSQIGAALSGGPKRYAPIYMRTDASEVLMEDFANSFYLGMRLSTTTGSHTYPIRKSVTH